MGDQRPEEGLANEAGRLRLTRRELLTRAAALGLSTSVLAALGTACGSEGGEKPAAQATSGSSVPKPTAASSQVAPQVAKSPGKEKALRVRIGADMQTADPAHIGQSADHAVAFLVHRGLVKYKAGSLDVVPDLATDWKISDGGKVYTFNLRKGVKWHKGFGELTAEDVVYSIGRIKDPATKSRFQADVDVIDKVEAPDKYVVRFTLKNPFSPFLGAILAFRPGWILNKKAVEERGDQFGMNPVGCGPYVFDTWSRGTEVVLKRNPDFYEPLDIDKVSFKVIKEETVAELALRSGDLDLSYIYEGESAERLMNDKPADLESKSLPGYRTQWTSFNITRPAVKDVRVRKAIIHAINKKAAAEAVYKSLGQPVSSIFNPNIPGWINPDPFPYDPAKAKQLLADAGYANGLDVKMIVQPNVGWPELATVLQDQWRVVGIRAELVIRERAVYDEMSQKGQDWDIDGHNISRADAFQYAAFLYGPNIPFPNNHHYKGADDIIEAAIAESDDAKRLELWKKFQEKALIEDVAGFGMTNVKYVLAWHKGIKGVDAQYQDSYPIDKMTME